MRELESRLRLPLQRLLLHDAAATIATTIATVATTNRAACQATAPAPAVTATAAAAAAADAPHTFTTDATSATP
jgi:hypothetical protein